MLYDVLEKQRSAPVCLGASVTVCAYTLDRWDDLNAAGWPRCGISPRMRSLLSLTVIPRCSSGPDTRSRASGSFLTQRHRDYPVGG